MLYYIVLVEKRRGGSFAFVPIGADLRVDLQRDQEVGLEGVLHVLFDQFESLLCGLLRPFEDELVVDLHQ